MQPNEVEMVDCAARQVAPAGPSMSRRLRIVLAVLCGVAVANMYYAQPLLEQIGSDLSLPTASLGLIVALAQLGYLVGLIALVPLGDLVDRRKLIGLQIAAAATGTLLVAFSATNVQLLIGITVVGVFSVVVQVIVAYAAAISDPDERGANIGVITSSVVVGIILARTVAGVVADLAGWRVVYLGSAVISIVIAAVALAMLPKDVRQQPKQGTYVRAIGSVVTLTATNRVFRTRALIALFLFASFGALWSGMALPLSEESWRLSTTQIGLFGVAGLVGALGAVGAGRWSDQGKGQQVTGLSLVVLVLSWVLSGQAMHSLVLLAVGVIALDFAVQAVHVTSQNLIVAEAPELAGRIIGSYMVFYSLGSAIGATSTTIVFQAAGWSAASILGGAYATAALSVWILDRLRD
ncbi:MFS transporter [Rhodococcus sp. KBS0724]|jgi:predicted MFS family arabinose efflux permease|uniref:MFS transporter n=1 Tax=Rhodococcus sp. KBS0724 TaxID=1179674 RepID=UPI0021B0CFF2|nr:MFS transporter [Rhodococcus sp. KBS0724]